MIIEYLYYKLFLISQCHAISEFMIFSDPDRLNGYVGIMLVKDK